MLLKSPGQSRDDTNATSPAPQHPRPHRQHPGPQRPVLATPSGEAHLQGLVVPAVCPVLAAASAVQELERPVGVAELQAARGVQAHQADAALDHVQRVPVGRVCGAGKQGRITCPTRAGGPSAQPHTPQADTHRHPDLEPALTPALSQWVVWEVSQTVLSAWTKPRAPLSLTAPLAVVSAASRCVVSGPACQGERSWGRAFSMGIRLYARGGAPTVPPYPTAPARWHTGMFICPERRFPNLVSGI